MQAVSKGLEKVEQELAASENDGEISAGFQKVRNTDDILVFSNKQHMPVQNFYFIKIILIMDENVGQQLDISAELSLFSSINSETRG